MLSEPVGQPAGRRLAPSSPTPAWVLVITTFYSLSVLTLAGWLGVRLYEWARLRTLQSMPLTTKDVPIANAQAVNTPVTSAVTNGVVVASQPVATPVNPSAVALPPINILLLGTDARPEDPSPPRTDTMMLLTLDQQNGTAGMLSLPRDLFVPIPGFDMSAKINTAYTFGEQKRYPGGGPQLAKDTVSNFVGQPVNYFVRVNFHGFVELIDLIGGVDINVAKTIHDEEYPTADYGVETFHLDAGPQHLDGSTALKYVRTRHTDSDFGRARRQQDLLRAVLDKVRQANMWPTLLAQAPTLVYTMRSSISTDMEMATQLSLVNYIRQHPLKEVRQLVIDDQYGEPDMTTDWGYILKPDREKVRAALRNFFQASTSATSGAAAPAPTDPATLRIELLNGTGEPGIAARTRQLLEARGWHVVAIGDADRNNYQQTMMVNYGVSDQAVEKVGAVLNLPTSQAHALRPSGVAVDLQIVLGTDILAKIK